ncbi:MAG: insulinase family protein, partial [Rikenellaceae bacterium]
IREATISQVEAFHTRYYTPSNAILTIAADLPEGEMFDYAQKWFGDLDSRPAPIDDIRQEPPQTEARELTLHRDVPVSLIYIAFRIGDRLSREYTVCDVITDLLSNGTSSRLYQRLIKEQTLFSSVNAYVTSELDGGMLMITARLLETTTTDQAKEALWRELDELTQSLCQDHELQKIKNKYEAQNLFSEINVLNKAINLSFYEMLGDANLINSDVENHNSVTALEIQQTARELFTPERSNTILYLSNTTHPQE